jgi:hypothetical protein
MTRVRRRPLDDLLFLPHSMERFHLKGQGG